MEGTFDCQLAGCLGVHEAAAELEDGSSLKSASSWRLSGSVLRASSLKTVVEACSILSVSGLRRVLDGCSTLARTPCLGVRAMALVAAETAAAVAAETAAAAETESKLAITTGSSAWNVTSKGAAKQGGPMPLRGGELGEAPRHGARWVAPGSGPSCERRKLRLSRRAVTPSRIFVSSMRLSGPTAGGSTLDRGAAGVMGQAGVSAALACRRLCKLRLSLSNLHFCCARSAHASWLTPMGAT